MAKSPLTKWLKIIAPLALGAFFVWYSLSSTTHEERESIWINIKNADLFWVFVSMLLGFLSHLIRANRWKLLLKPLNDNPKLYNCFYAVMFGYLGNLGIPRSGEVIRGVSYASYTNLSFEQSFGTIITERVIDLIMLLSIIGITFLLQADELLIYLNLNNINPLFSLIYLAVGVLLLFVFLKIIKSSKNKLIIKLRVVLIGLIQGLKSVFKLKKRGSFIIQTISIWALYVAMFWVIKFAITGTADLSFGAAMIGFIAGSFAMSITSGGIGLYPLAIASVYELFDIPIETGQAFGWVLWTAQTVLVIIVGSLSAILLPIVNKNNRLGQ
jgi:uncharacterized protein (TIRG00374 family)